MGGGVSIPYVALRLVLGALRLGPPTSVSVLIPKGCGPDLEELLALVAKGELRMAEVGGRFAPEEVGKARYPRDVPAPSLRHPLFPPSGALRLHLLPYPCDEGDALCDGTITCAPLIAGAHDRRTSLWAASNQGAKWSSTGRRATVEWDYYTHVVVVVFFLLVGGLLLPPPSRILVATTRQPLANGATTEFHDTPP